MAEAVLHPYLLAIVPPPDIGARIDALRQEFSMNFQCFKALKPPVHLTLYTPLSLEDGQVTEQTDKLRKWVSGQSPFKLELSNFGFFDDGKSPVVFVNVIARPELKALNTGLSREARKLFLLEDRSKQRFHPHITIGYRDIPPEIFPKVKQAYGQRPFSAAFYVKHVCLFRHNGFRWELKYEMALADSTVSQGSLW